MEDEWGSIELVVPWGLAGSNTDASPRRLANDIPSPVTSVHMRAYPTEEPPPPFPQAKVSLPDTPLFHLPRSRLTTRPAVKETPLRHGRHGTWETALYPPPSSASTGAADQFLSGLKHRSNDRPHPRYLPGGRTTGEISLTGGAINQIERYPMSMMMWAPIVTGESRRMKAPSQFNMSMQQQLSRFGGPMTIPPPQAACRPYSTTSQGGMQPLATVVGNARRQVSS
ncbi:hypothetical protein AB1Y20_021150 [Prymnesium parvum]|uniref:Uncharacterized protein n=1 Tax=Prymnesium parvum TaxID=97485 RepID=A0AB34JKI1_PRYPA